MHAYAWGTQRGDSGLSYLRPSALQAALNRGVVALALTSVGLNLNGKEAESCTWVGIPFLRPPEPQSKFSSCALYSFANSPENMDKHMHGKKESGWPPSLQCTQIAQPRSPHLVWDFADTAPSSLMPPRNFNLKQPLSSWLFFLNYNILLLFYFTYQFCKIYSAVSGKCYVTIPQKTLNFMESPPTFRSFISFLPWSFLIQPPHHHRKQWIG